MMRPDQLQRLADLSERLADSFLYEAEPAEWPGDGKSPADLTTQERGDRYWCKKNAMATGGVLKFALDLVRHHETETGAQLPEADLDDRIKEAEKESAKAIRNAQDRALKRAADERTQPKR